MASEESEDDIFNYKPLKKRKKEDPCKSSQHIQTRLPFSTSSPKLSASQPAYLKPPARIFNRRWNSPHNSKSKVKKSPSTLSSFKGRNQILSRNVNSSGNTSLSGSNNVSLNGNASTSGYASSSSTLITPVKKNSGNCPRCQMPFRILLGQSPELHVALCLDKVFNFETECPDGLNCRAEILCHFERFSHNALARERSESSQRTEMKEKLNDIEVVDLTLSSVVEEDYDSRYMTHFSDSHDEFQEDKLSVDDINSLPVSSNSSRSASPSLFLRDQYSGLSQVNQASLQDGVISQHSLHNTEEKSVLPSQTVPLILPQEGNLKIYGPAFHNKNSLGDTIIQVPGATVKTSLNSKKTFTLKSGSLSNGGNPFSDRHKEAICNSANEDDLTRTNKETINEFENIEVSNSTGTHSITASVTHDATCNVVPKTLIKYTARKSFGTSRRSRQEHDQHSTSKKENQIEPNRGQEEGKMVTRNESTDLLDAGSSSQTSSMDTDKKASELVNKFENNELGFTHCRSVTEDVGLTLEFPDEIESEKEDTDLETFEQSFDMSQLFPELNESDCLSDDIFQREEKTFTHVHQKIDIKAQQNRRSSGEISKEPNKIVDHSVKKDTFCNKSSKYDDIDLSIVKKSSSQPSPKKLPRTGSQSSLHNYFTSIKDSPQKPCQRVPKSSNNTDTNVTDDAHIKQPDDVSDSKPSPAKRAASWKEFFARKKDIFTKPEKPVVESKKRSGGMWSQQPAKQCPFYKKIPGTTFAVDAFRYGTVPGISAYFLTHFHADHYGGLTKHFTHTIFCSKITANLVKLQLRVSENYIHVLPMNSAQVIESVKVTFLDANHCPGSVLILFQLHDGRTFLHTGDFRADPCMEAYPPLQRVRIDHLYLDTTYCDPSYAFPKQSEVVQFAVDTSLQALQENPKTLIVCGTYTIGKERVFKAIAKATGSRVWVDRQKKRIYDCLEDRELNNMLSLDKKQARVHVVSMGMLTKERLWLYLSDLATWYSHILAFKPTGWTHTKSTSRLADIRPTVKGVITIYGIPYSEHSSFLELKRFVQYFRPVKILPTVNNGSAKKREEMQSLFQTWLAEDKPNEGRSAKNFKHESLQNSTITKFFKQ